MRINPIYATPIFLSTGKKTSFAGIVNDKIDVFKKSEPLINDLRDIPDLPCAICGKLVIPNQIYTRFDRNNADIPSKEVFKILEPYEKRIQGHEKRVYLLLKKYSQMFPEHTIKEILNNEKIYTFYLENLEHKQNLILKEIEKEIPKFSEITRNQIRKTLKYSRKMIHNENRQLQHRRGKIIQKFNNISVQHEELKDYTEILKKINNLPYSKNDVSAFMVKYAQRNSNETIQNILQPFCATNEHIRPNHIIFDKKMPDVEKPPRGESFPKNFIILHQRCNRLRGQLPYDEMIEKKTKLVENMQKYFDRVIEFINSGKMNVRYDYYPEEAAKTLNDESSGVINIDTSALKPPVRGPFMRP